MVWKVWKINIVKRIEYCCDLIIVIESYGIVEEMGFMNWVFKMIR